MSAARSRDPLARKLIEWTILRAEDDDVGFDRYAAFIAANPSWPHIDDAPAQPKRALAGQASRHHRARLLRGRRSRLTAKGKSRARPRR